MFSWLDIEN